LTKHEQFDTMQVMIDFAAFAQDAGKLLDAVGVVVILAGALLSTLAVIISFFRRKGIHNLYRNYRHNLARSILIGLEFLVAGDIIRSVAGNLSLDSVLILAIIVAIRSLLGMEFEMEIEGHWPWQRSQKKTKSTQL
jgi:uncharacterized membrane protein